MIFFTLPVRFYPKSGYYIIAMRKVCMLVVWLSLCFVAAAQDSVLVMGTVVNRLSGEAEPYCTVHFLRGADTAATVLCDEEGGFFLDGLPAGSYGLSVTLRGMTLYQADLVLNSNAALSISVITDSFQFRTLHEVEIMAPKHDLATSGLLITSPDDDRLWDFMYCDWCLWSGPPRQAAASNSGDPNNPEGRVKWGRFYRPAKGSKYIGIWQILWPDRVMPAPKERQAKEEKKESSSE